MVDDLKTKAIDFINHHSLAALATIGPDGQPRAASIYIVADADLNLYFTTKSATAKYKHAEQNDRVALVITSEQDYETIQVQGTIQEEHAMAKVSWIISNITHVASKHEQWHPPIDQLDAEGYVFMKITPSWMRWGNFREESQGGPIFQQVIPPENK